MAGPRRRGAPAHPGRGMSADGQLTVGLAQVDSALGNRDRNLARHREWVARAVAAGVKLLVFPELSLTGYFLRDLVVDSAIRLGGPAMKDLLSLSSDLDGVLGAVIEDPDHRYFNASLYRCSGALLHVPRKACLPTSGIFDEQRYRASGDGFGSVQ